MEPTSCRLLDASERSAVAQALACLVRRPADRALLGDALGRLERLGELVSGFPSLLGAQELGGQRRGPETLVARLVGADAFQTPLDLPLRAVLARDFVLAKVQTFRAVERALAGLAPPAPEGVRAALRREIEQSVHTLLLDQLLVESLMDPSLGTDAKVRAAELLIGFWDRCTELEVDDFVPLLEAAWEARNRLVVEFGTLIGSVETVRLLETAGHPELVDALLGGDDDDPERRQAFEEFLFGLSYEQLEHVRREMQRAGVAAVDRAWVARTLGLGEAQLFSGIAEPEAAYLSYQRRQAGASFRRLRGVEGPRRTAEAYLLAQLLGD